MDRAAAGRRLLSRGRSAGGDRDGAEAKLGHGVIMAARRRTGQAFSGLPG